MSAGTQYFRVFRLKRRSAACTHARAGSTEQHSPSMSPLHPELCSPHQHSIVVTQRGRKQQHACFSHEDQRRFPVSPRLGNHSCFSYSCTSILPVPRSLQPSALLVVLGAALSTPALQLLTLTVCPEEPGQQNIFCSVTAVLGQAGMVCAQLGAPTEVSFPISQQNLWRGRTDRRKVTKPVCDGGCRAVSMQRQLRQQTLVLTHLQPQSCSSRLRVLQEIPSQHGSLG